MNRFSLFFIILILVIFLICSCFSPATPGNDDNKIGISGTLSNSYTVRNRAGSSVDKVMAVPVVMGTVNLPSIINSQMVDINADGSFSLSLETTSEWILVLIDSQAASKKEQIVGYVAMKDVTDSLMKMPIPDAQSDITLGTITPSGDEAVSVTTITDNADNFTVTVDQLREMAKTDNLLKNITNFYVNYDENTGVYYQPLIGFGWDNNTATDVKNKFSDHTAYNESNYGMICSVNTNTTSPTFSDIANEVVSLGLYAPAPFNTQWTSQISSITNAGVTQVSGEPGLYINQTFGVRDNTAVGGHTFLTFGIDYSILTVPDGAWVLKANTQELASFTINLAKPIDEAGHPNVYIPSIRVNVDGSDTVTSFDIKWYYYDNAISGYTEVTDLSILGQSLSNFAVAFTDSDGDAGNRLDENLNFTDSATQNSNGKLSELISFSDFTYTWKFLNASSGTYIMDLLYLIYEYGGVTFSWTWHPAI